ncbi:hypothetical protein ABIB94_007913 [Bradyrhizobium sp. JR7.2]|uniref:hypothetical protein n=1 Tax=unclassified Bradyrhizobium TaxID=2631580 RepID=UPI0033923120
MPNSDRAARVELAKALRRIAYRLARDGEIVSNVELEGEGKQLTEYRRGFLLVDLGRPWRWGAFETEFSRLRYAGEKARAFSTWCSSGLASGKAPDCEILTSVVQRNRGSGFSP